MTRERLLENKRLYYQRHRERILREQKEDRQRNPAKYRLKARVQRERHRDADRARKKKWQDAHFEERKQMSRRWRRANKEKVHAHNAVAWAVKRGTLKKPKACQSCCSKGRIVAHHDDYSKPLEVRWLCDKCHNQHHFMIAA